MTDQENKPREFWFDTEINDGALCVLDLHLEKPEFETDYHVIEYSSYQVLEQRHQKLVEALEKLSKKGNTVLVKSISRQALEEDKKMREGV